MTNHTRRRDGRVRVLALSSGGGHWVQLLRLRPAFDGCDVVFATVKPEYQMDVPGEAFRVIPDANRWSKISLLRSALGVLRVLWRERPDVVVSTGAAPGYFAIRLAPLLRARTIWVDSVANIDELSLSGRRAGAHASLWLTQWPHLARPGGPYCRGSVL